MKNAAARIETFEDPNLIKGKAPIVRAVFEGRDISPIWDELFGRVSADPTDAAAFLDVSILLHAIGEEDKAVLSQKAALEISRKYRIANGRGTGPNVLVFVTAGDFMANTPIEFLLEESDANILLHYVDADTADLNDVPEHDVAFVAVGESAANLPVLETLDRLLRGWPGPILNNAPRRIMDLSRDGVAETLKDEPSILAPAAARVSRDAIGQLACGQIEVASILGAGSYPVIVRPVGTHAGKGMEKISTPLELSTYLDSQAEAEFFVTPFIDYSGPDGKFRKQRIAFINGRAYASHLGLQPLDGALSERRHDRARRQAWRRGVMDGQLRQRFFGSPRAFLRCVASASRARLFRHRLRRACRRPPAPVRGGCRHDRPFDGLAEHVSLQEERHAQALRRLRGCAGTARGADGVHAGGQMRPYGQTRRLSEDG
ncbi:tetratricopeptide repeat-containing protein [Mesorhizobium sp. PAMC28654]|uniref:tetratricopeptide repeat-containing protein n=1 Tax=Mesorhizobium sp. PAMC28654 TaxID=2880934 RepID=UPI001D0AEFF2|nr:tetratricopeptide repeat-containing protein [Mesorhizobium sp. PAMC28654]UDL89423.1 tetratricopeptide repeat-containing protein [Mesorhizobium sp. PAMC28654]